MRILVIEDDTSMAAAIELVLRSEGWMCEIVDLGATGLEICKIYEYDAIILDLMLPDIDGFEFLRRLRGADIEVPVLIVSGWSATEFKVKGLCVGADDYLTKPFDERELLARLRAVVRRSRGHAEKVIRTGSLAVNIDRRTTEVDSRSIHLTNKEYQVLELLALRKGKIVAKDTLLGHLYGGMDVPDLKIIDVFVCKLRKKLALAGGGESSIETHWGRGYMLREVPVAESGANATMALAAVEVVASRQASDGRCRPGAPDNAGRRQRVLEPTAPRAGAAGLAGGS